MQAHREPHTLEQELSLLVRRDSEIFDLLRDSALDGLSYCDLEHPEREYRDASFWRALGHDSGCRDERASAAQQLAFPEDLDLARGSLAAHLADPAQPYDLLMRYRHRDGSTVWMRCRGAALRDEAGRPVRMLGAHHDVSALVRAEHEARARAEELRRNRDSARGAELGRGQFLAYLGHELRTPLDASIGLARAALRGELAAQPRERLEQALAASEALLRVVDDAVELASIEAGEVALQPAAFSPREVVEDALRPLRPLAERKGVALDARVGDEVPRVLMGDGERLGRVLGVLADNALHCTQRGEVALRIECDAGTGRVPLRVSVRDGGIETPPHIPTSLFECFAAPERGRPPRPGQRLALALCRRLVQKMGGALRAAAVPGGGLFEFTVPFERPARGDEGLAQRPAHAGASEGEARPLEILLAEDTESSRKVVFAMLQESRHHITVADDGRRALDLISEREFDLVLMDLEMPELDGWEATRAIRARERASGRPRVPIIALTAHALRATRDECLALGMDDYLAKPVRLEQLRAAIARAARSAREANA